jgi:hypothetical protein
VLLTTKLSLQPQGWLASSSLPAFLFSFLPFFLPSFLPSFLPLSLSLSLSLSCLFIYLFIYLLLFQDRISLCSPGCPGIHFAFQAGLELSEIRLLHLPSAGIKDMCHFSPKDDIFNILVII